MVAPIPGRPEAAEVIWKRGADAGTPGADAAAARAARIRGAVQAAIGATVGTILLYFFELETLPYILFASASILLFTSLVSPTGLFAALEHMLGAVSGRLGRGIMWLSLGAVFYSFFVPFGLLFRRGKRDRLKRSLDPQAKSYWNWEPSEGPTSADPSRTSQH